MNTWIEEIVEFVSQEEQASTSASVLAPIGKASRDDMDQLLASLASHHETACDAPLQHALAVVVDWFRAQKSSDGGVSLSPEQRQQLADFYRHLGSQSCARIKLLGIFTQVRGEDDLRQFAELVATDPPCDDPTVTIAFVALFQRDDWQPEWLFPRLLDSVEQLGLAAIVLDLANFLHRSGRATNHPATERAPALAKLLSALVHHLLKVQESPPKGDDQSAQKVSRSLEVLVPLCDTVALIGQKGAVGALHEALNLDHRRVRTEAAAALTRLGDEVGEKTLLVLAEHASVRRRVLAYAKELGVLEKVSEEYLQAEALAEADVSAWLSEPQQFGIPPHDLELIEARESFWPGFEQPVPCFLFRFEYDMPNGRFANVAIAGPIVHAMTADLTKLDADNLLAIFAGWHAQHDEIRETPVSKLDGMQKKVAEQLGNIIEQQGFSHVSPDLFGEFFGQPVLVATAQQEEAPGVVLCDGQELTWHPAAESQRPLGPSEVYWLYKGLKLMASFGG